MRGPALWAPIAHHVVDLDPWPAHGGSIRSVWLTKRQRNEIFETLAASGVAPDTCKLDYVAGAPRLASDEALQALRDRLSGGFSPPAQRGTADAYVRHEVSGSSFRFKGDSSRDGHYVASMTVGHVFLRECSSCVWNQLMENLAEWAKEVRYETDTPDLWAEFQRVPEILIVVQDARAINAPFTPAEQAQISNQFDEIKQLVREQYELTDDQLAAIDQRLDQAEEASTRLGRRDWAMMFYGGVMSTFMTDAVPPGVIQTVLITVLHGIGHIFGFGGPPPIIST